MNKKIMFLLISISIFLVAFITIKYFENKGSYVTYYILQEGAFKNYNGVIKTTRNYNNYVISKEDELYKIYIGVTLDKEVYNKLISMYSKTSSTYMKKVNINKKLMLFYVCGLIKNQSFFVVNLLVASKYYKK